MSEVWSECPGNFMGRAACQGRGWCVEETNYHNGNLEARKWKVPCPWQRGLNYIISKVPSNPRHSVILSQALHSAQPAAVGCTSDLPSQTRSCEASAMCQCPCLPSQQTAASAGISQCKCCWEDV